MRYVDLLWTPARSVAPGYEDSLQAVDDHRAGGRSIPESNLAQELQSRDDQPGRRHEAPGPSVQAGRERAEVAEWRRTKRNTLGSVTAEGAAKQKLFSKLERSPVARATALTFRFSYTEDVFDVLFFK